MVSAGQKSSVIPVKAGIHKQAAKMLAKLQN